MMETMMIENIFAFVLVLLAGLFAYMSSHIVAEKKKGETIPLPWEKNRLNKTSPDMGTVKFVKQRLPYRDGDNT